MSGLLRCSSGHTWQDAAVCPRCGAAAEPAKTAAAPGGAWESTLAVSDAPPLVRPPLVPGYEIVHELGRGGMGVVYLARQIKLNRLVALKMILAGPHADESVRRRFQIEAEAVAALQHPNIVQIHEVGETDDLPWLALEYVPGTSLAQWLAGRPQPPRIAASLVAVLARAIAHAHGRGILHRDLKPANVLLASWHDAHGTDGTDETDESHLSHPSHPSHETRQHEIVPKITDFGLARRLEGGGGATQAGDIMGTPSYMAPEQASGVTRQPGPGIDVWALGAILYECLTGRPPFLTNSAMETLLQVISAEPTPPRQLNAAAPLDLDTIALKCLEKSPRRRYASAADLAGDLERYLDGRPILARPVGTGERIVKWARRRPVAAAFAGFVALAVLFFLGVVTAYNSRLRRERDEKDRLYGEAETAHAREKEQRRQAESRLLRSYLAQSTQLLERGDLFAALPLQVEALALEAGDDKRERMHRLRIGTVLSQAPRLVRLWRHGRAVHDAAFSPDGRLAASAGEDGRVLIWDVETGKPHGNSLRHSGAVRLLAFRPDGKVLAAGTQTGEVRLWDVATGKPLSASVRHTGEVLSLSFSPDGRLLVSAGRDGRAGVQHADGSGSPVWFFLHSGPIRHAGFSPDSKQVVTTGDDHRAWVWDARTGAVTAGPMPHSYPVLHAAFRADGKQLATASGQSRGSDDIGGIVVWDLVNPEKSRRFKPGRTVRRVVWSKDGRRLLAGLHNGEVLVWDVETASEIAATIAARHRDAVTDIHFNPDERRVLTASADGTARIWEVNTAAQALYRFTPPLHHGGVVRRALFSHDGRRVLTASADGSVRLWDLAPLAPDVPPLDQRLCHTAAFSPDGASVLTAGYDGTARLWDVKTGLPRTGELWHGLRIVSADFSPDGQRVVTTGFEPFARLWNTANGELVALLPHDAAFTTAAAFSPDGALLATGNFAGSVRLWDARTASPRAGPMPAGERIQRISFTADGKYLLIQTERSARIWQIEPLRPAGETMQHGADAELALASARLAPDGRHVLTAGGDGTARLWQAPGGQPAGTLLRHHSGLSLAVFDGDGGRLAALGRDRTATVLDANGKVLCGPLAHADVAQLNAHLLNAAAFSPDDELLLVVGSDGLARVWEAAVGELAAAPWAHPYGVFSAAFHPDGRQLLVSAWSPDGPGFAVIHRLVEEPLPVESLRFLAGLLSGQRVGPNGRLEELLPEAVDEAWQALHRRDASLFEVSTEQALAWYRWEVDACLRTGNVAGMKNNLAPLLNAEPGRWTHHMVRARLLAYEKRLGDAADSYEKAVQLGSNDEKAWRLQAFYRLQVNDLAGYRRACAGVVKRFGATRVPDLAWSMANICLMLPDAVKDFRPVVSLAECSWKHTPKDPDSLSTLGTALLRAGRTNEARQRLQEAVLRHGRGGLPVHWLMLALAEARRGDPPRAGFYYNEATRASSRFPGMPEARLLAILRREVEGVLSAVRAGAN